MITEQLLNPKSIVIVGGSNDIHKAGGKVLKNLIDNNFKGFLYVVNPKESTVQGISSYPEVSLLPPVDLAILAVPARYCPDMVDILAHQKNTRAFIIFSAGFSEESEEGKLLEKMVVDTINSVNGSLIGPNCIGIINQVHSSVFTTPIPKLDPKGCDFFTGSGATAVFILENGIQKGLTFSSVYSVGNCAQIGVEEVLKHFDETFDPKTSSRVKLLYIENIKKPDMLLKHASSLIRKGCRIAAIKAGSSDAGSRAASSHTGAMASPDVAVDALFRKAGIVRCYGRDELNTVASIFMHKKLEGKNIAIITHAGGPAVMLTKLYPGSSVANPIDFLATGTAEQLGIIIDYCDNNFDIIDAMIVIFGSPGLFEVYDVYKLLDEKMRICKKPIFPVLPSVVNLKDEIEHFLATGRINFPDEVILGKALAKVYYTPKPQPEICILPEVDEVKIRNIIDHCSNGYLSPIDVQGLLDAAGIPRAGEAVVTSRESAVNEATKIGFPVVMKVIGPVHKSDVGGVCLNVKDIEKVASEFDRMIKIKDTTAILIQPMLSGTELFVGAKYEPKFGHLILCGLGGIFIELLKDISSSLSPVSYEEALNMITKLKGFKILKGARGIEEVNIDLFAGIINKLSALLTVAPEIFEMDINPLLGKKDKVVAVDARIRVEKM